MDGRSFHNFKNSIDQLRGNSRFVYEQELQKTKQDIFRIENIIKQEGNKSLVKCLGYYDSFNSWVDIKDIKKL